MNLRIRNCFVVGRGISTPRKPNIFSQQAGQKNARERIPFIREGAKKIPVQAIYEDSGKTEKL